MGQLDNPRSEHQAALSCNSCGLDYYTDSKQDNVCPNCGAVDFEVNGREH